MRTTMRVVAGICAALLLLGAAGATASTLISGKQIKDGTVTGTDVKNKSLTRADFKGSVRGPAGRRGPAGPQGPTGARGPAGATGPAGPPGHTPTITLRTVDGPSVEVPDGSNSVEADVSCPSGMFATGGGGVTDGGNATLTDSFTDGDPGTNWVVFYRNTSGTDDTVNAEAICASAG
jgi:hypothetical protein